MIGSKALIIFDWDDTLFPTHWSINNGNLLSGDYLHKLDMAISRLLGAALKQGMVLIITNATMEWITISKNMLPISSNIIDVNIKIISARDLYHHVYDMGEWKKMTFINNIRNYITRAEQIISIGDAKYEYNALIALRNYVPHSILLKSVWLVNFPSYDILIDQLNILTKSLSDLCNHKYYLDLKMLMHSNNNHSINNHSINYIK